MTHCMTTLRLDPQGDYVRGPTERPPARARDAAARASNALPSTVASRAFYLLNRSADALGLFRRPLSADQLITAARRRTGLTDLGDWDIEEPLARLIDSYEREANLSAFGRFAVRWDVVRFVSNLLQLRDEEKRNPAISEQQIERPIFITGLPRSGTSFLHELLCRDSSNFAVLHWQTIYPCPLTPGSDDADRRRRKVQGQIRSFERIVPEIRNLHPFHADSPQECTEITGHIFRGMRFDTTHRIPSYQRWLDHESHVIAYRFHKRFLQHRQYRRGPGRWVLKCPEHVFTLDALRSVYPDARFVFTHRDPLPVLASVARLTEALRLPFTTSADRGEIGAEVSERWAKGVSLMLAAAKQMRQSSEPLLHVQFSDFVRDPVADSSE